MEIFNDYAYYYNMFYGNKDYQGEANVIHDLINKYGKISTKKLLNLGCGTGRHDYELNKLGYHIKGIDLSQNMVEIAKEKYHNIPNLEFEVGDARYYSVQNRYDAVISLFHVMSYQNENVHVKQMMKTAYDALEEGGLFIFDAWYGPGVLTDRPAIRKKEVEDKDNRIVRFAQPTMDPNKNLVDVNYDVYVFNKSNGSVSEIRETHKMRYFFMPEIEFFLCNAGFKLLACLDCNNMQEPDFQSWTTYFIAIKEN